VPPKNTDRRYNLDDLCRRFNWKGERKLGEEHGRVDHTYVYIADLVPKRAHGDEVLIVD
jgi:hypothetical protein